MRNPDRRVLSLRLSEELRFGKFGGVLSGAYQMAATVVKTWRGETAVAVTAATKTKGFDSTTMIPAAKQSSYQK